MSKVISAGVFCIECGCKKVVDIGDESQFVYCPQCSLENALSNKLSAERTAAELRAQLATVTAKLNESQHFIQSIIDHSDKHDGTIESGTRININKAERLAGVEP